MGKLNDATKWQLDGALGPTHVITDLGESFDYEVVGKEEKEHLCRYGVWVVDKGVADHVIEMGDDLEKLKEDYPQARVVELKGMTLGGKDGK